MPNVTQSIADACYVFHFVACVEFDMSSTLLLFIIAKTVFTFCILSFNDSI
jgi:hypothetical protein